MTTVEQKKHWETLTDLIEISDKSAIKDLISQLNSEEVVSTISHINAEERSRLLTLLHPEEAADIIEDIPYVQAVEIIEDLEAKDAAAIIGELQSDDQADIINDLEKEDAELILSEMKPEEAENIRKLLSYHDDVAGGQMITEFLAFDEKLTVEEVATTLREKSEEYKGYNVQYIYVTSGDQFVGVLQMRDLVLSKPGDRLSKIVIRDALTVRDDTPLTDLIRFFDEYDFYGVPVLNEKDQLVGVVLRKDILEEETERANMELLETQGIVGGEELRTMPVFLRSRRRLSWLSVNILLNIIAASVIAFYQDTLSSVIALAVFLPIISDMSGCSGNQAVAVSLRELTIGVVKPFEVFRVWVQEISVGLINGIALGILIGSAAWLWKGNVYLGVVVGGALAVNTIVAVSLGGIIPLILKRYKIDPALASGPLLTTVTDMFGFFLALSFASVMLAYIS